MAPLSQKIYYAGQRAERCGFLNQYEDALNRAWQVYGVPPEIIVGIIGVETRWGRVMGKTVSSMRWQRCHLTTHAARSISLASWKPSC